MKKIVFAALVLFSIAGCSDDDNNYTGGNNAPVSISFTNITKGVLTGDAVTAGNFVIRTQDEWNDFKEQTGITPAVPVDFSIHEVIAVVDQQYTNSEFMIEITSITKIDNKVTVKIVKTQSDEPVIEATQALHVVRIAKQGVPVVFDVDAPL
jgi:hypothetical protein